MSNVSLVKIEATTAAEICARFLVRQEARALLRDGMTPGAFIEALINNKQYIAGIDFLAHALPPREAVWWGCLCFQHAWGDRMSAVDQAAATTVVQWVLQPSDSTRGAAKVQAESVGPASVAGALAMAAYQTGPGIASPCGRPAAAPPPFGTAQAVANAVKLACTKSDPARIVETQRGFVGLGVGVAAGRFM
ncbi:MAG TPA: hypothetical protein VK335_03675 [Bryobacteraceae bacterium]|nr:hypothetical protein [Bryobacteraceae bacterium]